MSGFMEYRIEIEPMKKEKFLDRDYWDLCNAEEAERYGVYYNDDLENVFETVEEAEKYLAERFARVAVENSLYHVHEYEDGENTSLLVVAKTTREAVRFFDEQWRENGLEPGESGQDIIVHVIVDLNLNKPGPLRWGVLGGMVLVGKKPLDEWLEEEKKDAQL